MAAPRPQPPLVPQLSLRSEEGCFATSTDRKYYRRGNAFIKRCLRPREFLHGPQGIHIPRLRKESLKNEADTLRFINRHTEIPVPLLFCDFEDDDAYYLITEYIEGVSMADLPEHQKDVVIVELKNHLARLKTLKSNRMGGPSGIVIPPYRVLCETERDDWSQLRPSDHAEYVFCHNDCSQHNIIVNPTTLKIAAIVDWEYAGFYPEYFEFPFYLRKGPSVALGEEEDDTYAMLHFLNSQLSWEVWTPATTPCALSIVTDVLHSPGPGATHSNESNLSTVSVINLHRVHPIPPRAAGQTSQSRNWAFKDSGEGFHAGPGLSSLPEVFDNENSVDPPARGSINPIPCNCMYIPFSAMRQNRVMQQTGSSRGTRG